jgi:superfamily II DNA or RNA helicase
VIYDTLRLRPYQTEAQQAIVSARDRGVKSQLVSLATGLGKTVIIATLPRILELRPTDVILVVAHRDELIQQIVDKMRSQNPQAHVGIEKAEERASIGCSIVVATVQTLTGKRLDEFALRFGRRIGLFVIDEAHHAAAPTYRAILDKVTAKRNDALVIGFTATPQRGDGARLGEVFDETVYAMDARAAIDSGYLVPVRSYAISSDTDLDAVASRGGDFVLGALAEAVDTEERNHLIIDAYLTYTPKAKALVFTASVEHARHVAQLFLDEGVKAAFASGETKDDEREAIVAGFRGDRIDVLVNCGLYLEGFDVPSIEVIINARPTKSTTLYTQITGRGLRPLDELSFVLSNLPTADPRREVIAQSRKPYAIVIDIVDQVRRHQLVTLPALWGLPSQIDSEGRPISEVARRYEELCERSPRDAARVRTAAQIETALIDLDDTSQVKPVWQPVGVDHWRIAFPPKLMARDRRGRLIPHFAELFEQHKTMVQKIAPHESAQASALRLLNADPRSVRVESFQIDIEPRGDAFFATLRTSNGVPREIFTAASVVDAMGKSQELLESGALFAAPAPFKTKAPPAERRRIPWRRRRSAPQTATA